MSRDFSSDIARFSLVPVWKMKRNNLKEPKCNIHLKPIFITLGLGSGIAGCTYSSLRNKSVGKGKKSTD